MTNRKKQIIILISIISFLFVGISVYSQEPSPQPITQSKNPTKTINNTTNTSNNKTDNSVFLIKKICTQNNNKNTEDNANNQGGKTDTNRWIMWATIAIAFFALCQIIAMIFQYFVMQRQGKVIPKIERAYLFVTATMKSDETYIRDIKEGVSQKLHIMVKIKNHGKTPAILKTLRIIVNPRETTHPPKLKKLIEGSETFIPEGKVISAGEVYEYPTYVLISTQEWNNIKTVTTWLTCSGLVRYKDTISDTLRETGFLWQYYPFENYERFEISNNTKLNYYT
jgi:hypothetical protein